VLSTFDDYPIHPSSAPIADTASSDINHYDRYFFNGYTSDANVFFAAALGLYPNRHVADASFSVVLNGKDQISVHASCRAPHDRFLANKVGPIEVRVVEPMKQHRLLIDSPENGLRADLTMTARSGPVEEPHFLVKSGQRTVFDYTRLTQFGRWSGWIEVDGNRIEVSSADTTGSRDRSWGVRPVGPAQDVGAPSGDRQFYWLWAPVNFDTYATHFDVNEFSDGSRWHQTGFVVPDGDSPAVEMPEVRYRGEVRAGTRWMESFELELGDGSGSTRTVLFEPLYEFHMLGIGYGHPEWGHGHWKGELAVGGERWTLPVDNPCDPRYLHIQAVCRVRSGHDSGIGILEQLIIGPHAPMGLEGIINPKG